jgi:hypothetical protein
MPRYFGAFKVSVVFTFTRWCVAKTSGATELAMQPMFLIARFTQEEQREIGRSTDAGSGAYGLEPYAAAEQQLV